MNRKIPKILTPIFLGLLMLIGCNGDCEEPESIYGLDAEDFTRIASSGIDERRNSYPWSMEQFDGDGDGTPEIYVGTINNAICHQTTPRDWRSPPPEKWQCPNEFWDEDMIEEWVEAATGPAYIYQGRYDEENDAWNWQRVWEPDFETQVFGFRGARVFNNALYFLSNHPDGPTVWKTTNGTDFERASPPGMGAFEGSLIPPGFRGAQVFNDRLCITSDFQSAVYCSSDPSVEPDSWEQVNSTGFVASGGEVYEQILSMGKVATATETTLVDENKNYYQNVHADRFVRIVNGNGAGQSKRILSNDETTLTIEGTWETIPDCGSRFQVYNPEALGAQRIWQMAVFNDHLYAIAFGIGGSGPSLWKSSDPAPGNWTQVIEGGYGNPNIGFMTIRPFRDHLYIGTGTYPGAFLVGAWIEGCEILRIDADDNVELVVGEYRAPGVVGPDTVFPISCIDRGFGYDFNFYLWYMGEYKGWLYVGTFDTSGLSWDVADDYFSEGFPPERQELWDSIIGPPGFDLWRTRDGVEWIEVTDTGFGVHDNNGVRNLMSTQWGFFLGAANPVGGFEIWLGRKD